MAATRFEFVILKISFGVALVEIVRIGSPGLSLQFALLKDVYFNLTIYIVVQS